MKKKGFFVLILVFVAIVSLYFLVPYLYYSYHSWRIGRAYKQFEQAYFNYLKSDTYGGKTPEETYSLYLEALKKGDIDLASKYFWWEEQVAEKERLEKLKGEGKFQEYVDGLPEWGELNEEEYWVENGKRFSWLTYEEERTIELPVGQGKYEETVLPAGEYKHTIDFQLNQLVNIWKIY